MVALIKFFNSMDREEKAVIALGVVVFSIFTFLNLLLALAIYRYRTKELTFKNVFITVFLFTPPILIYFWVGCWIIATF